MTERDAFLYAIRLHPFEDTPRLVFADWLEENGEPGYAPQLLEFVPLPDDLDYFHNLTELIHVI